MTSTVDLFFNQPCRVSWCACILLFLDLVFVGFGFCSFEVFYRLFVLACAHVCVCVCVCVCV